MDVYWDRDHASSDLGLAQGRRDRVVLEGAGPTRICNSGRFTTAIRLAHANHRHACSQSDASVSPCPCVACAQDDQQPAPGGSPLATASAPIASASASTAPLPGCCKAGHVGGRRTPCFRPREGIRGEPAACTPSRRRRSTPTTRSSSRSQRA